MIFRPAALATSLLEVTAKPDHGWTGLIDTQTDLGSDHAFVRSCRFHAGVATPQMPFPVFQPIANMLAQSSSRRSAVSDSHSGHCRLSMAVL